MSNHVFVSFSSADRKITETIVNDIESHGIRCWVSYRDVKPGANYQQSIVDALSSASVMLLVFSENANKSREITKELSLASISKKHVVPARVEDIFPTGAFLYEMTNRQFIDLFADYKTQIRKLVETLEFHYGHDSTRLIRARKGKSLGRGYSLLQLFGGAGVVLLLAGLGAWVWFGGRLSPSGLVSAVPPTSVSTSATSAVPPGVPGTTPPIATANSPPSPAPPLAVPVPPAPPPAPATGGQAQQLGGDLNPAMVARALAAVPVSGRLAAAPDQLAKLSEPLSNAQAADILAGTGYGVRASLISAMRPFLRPGMSAVEAVRLLEGTQDAWLTALDALVPLLARPLDAGSIRRLVTPLSYGSRLRGLQTLEEVFPAELSARDADGLLQNTIDARPAALTLIERRLANNITVRDAALLLDTLGYGTRTRAITLLNRHIRPGISAADALLLLNGTADSWLDALNAIVGILAKPLSGDALAELLGNLGYGARVRGIDILRQVMPPTLTAAEAAILLRGTADSRLEGIRILEPRIERGVGTNDLVSLLEGLGYGGRVQGLQLLVPHARSGMDATDALRLLNGTGDAWLNALAVLTPVLARPISVPDASQLLGSLGYGGRVQGLRTLLPLLTPIVTATDVRALLQGASDSTADGIRLIATRLTMKTVADRDEVLETVQVNVRRELLGQLRVAAP